jgi:hypothetical protein
MIIEHAVQQLERELSEWRSLDEVKRYLRRAGFTQKAILSDAEMERVGNLVRTDPRAIETPDEELRYIEGLFGVPLGSIPELPGDSEKRSRAMQLRQNAERARRGVLRSRAANSQP